MVAEDEGHDRDQDQHAERGGLGDVEPFRDARPEAVGSIQIERAEREPPHEEDRQELERVADKGRDVVHRDDVEAHGVRDHPARRDEHEVGGQRQVLEEPRVGLQHRRPSRRSVQRCLM